MNKLSRIKVLYVEDDEFIREELVETLEFDVNELFIAENGEEGLKLFKDKNPDLVITDVKMPKMNGLEMAKEIKKLSPTTPIIITTAFSDSDYLSKAIEIGVNRYVVKPIDIDKLYEAMEELATILLYQKEQEIQNRYLKYILDFNPSFILIADNKKVEYINKTFLKFLGFNSFQEWKDKSCQTDDIVESISDINGNQFETKNWIKRIVENSDIQHIIHFKNSLNKPFIVFQNSFKDLNKDILLFSDITNLELNRLELNREILKLKEDNSKKLELLKIQTKQALMGEMISAIAHQWKQPLNALSMNFQLLKYEDNLSEDSIQFCVENGLKQIEYMSKTIDDFRRFLSPDKVMKSFSLSEVVDDILALFSKQLEVHNIDVEIVIKDVKVFGYKTELEQVLMNLIKNSKDAFDNLKIDNKYIKIKSEEIDNLIKIRIEDNAGGIDKKILNNIFNPYFTTKKDGTGIGLYISKMLMEDMKGGIDVKSENGKTEFILTIQKSLE